MFPLVKSDYVSHCVCAVFVFLALIFCAARTSAQAQVANGSPNVAKGSLFSIANKKRALLIVNRAIILDVNNGERAIVEQALHADPRLSRRYRLAYSTIAQKLNEYIRKHHSMTAVERLDDADYIIFFNLLEYRWPLGTPYPYGELFVIVKGENNLPTDASIVWKSEKVEWAGDAVKALIRQLRMIKGES